jgi:hypothetical protein
MMAHLGHEYKLLAVLVWLLAVSVHSLPDDPVWDQQEQMEDDDEQLQASPSVDFASPVAKLEGEDVEPVYSTDFARSVATFEGDVLDALTNFVVGFFNQISAVWEPEGRQNSTVSPPTRDPRLLKII